MVKGYLLLGSNLGDRETNLQKGLELISNDKCTILQTSSIYESEPWGYTDPNPYYNLVAEFETSLLPEQLLENCLRAENRLGRTRNSKEFEAREIDIDILFYGNTILNTEKLTVPHPRIQLRKFVLVPLAELCPDFVHPVLAKTMVQLLLECSDKSWVRLK